MNPAALVYAALVYAALVFPDGRQIASASAALIVGSPSAVPTAA